MVYILQLNQVLYNSVAEMAPTFRLLCSLKNKSVTAPFKLGQFSLENSGI